MRDWTRCFHPAPGARVRLVCFPHAGGSASAYHPLSAAVSGVVEPRVVQYPGRQDRYGEPFVEELDEVVDAVLDELPTGPPTALFGHSMGAVLAFETARRLQAAGHPPVTVFLSGRGAPGRQRPRPGGGPARTLDDAELIADMRLLSGTAPEVLEQPDLLQLLLPVMRADYLALARYRYQPGPPLDCPLIALTGDSDPRVTVQDTQAWQEQAGGSFACHVLPGGHFYLDDHTPRIAELITTALGHRQQPVLP